MEAIGESGVARAAGAEDDSAYTNTVTYLPSSQVSSLTTAFSGQLIGSPLMTVGSGSGWVYCYYLPYVRAAKEMARQRTWPCKIGFTTTDDVRDRIAEQFKTTGTFEAPEIGFCARCDNPKELEGDMHERLDSLMARTRREMIGGKGFGVEWYETNLREVRRAYREAMWPRSIVRRLWWYWKMETRARREGIDSARPRR